MVLYLLPEILGTTGQNVFVGECELDFRRQYSISRIKVLMFMNNSGYNEEHDIVGKKARFKI